MITTCTTDEQDGTVQNEYASIVKAIAMVLSSFSVSC